MHGAMTLCLVRPSCYFFIVILILRSFAVACVLVVPDTVTQLFTLQIILLLGSAASLYFAPWRVAIGNVVDCFGGGEQCESKKCSLEEEAPREQAC
eukprot:4984724-Amphidinium_carterae.1